MVFPREGSVILLPGDFPSILKSSFLVSTLKYEQIAENYQTFEKKAILLKEELKPKKKSNQEKSLLSEEK